MAEESKWKLVEESNEGGVDVVTMAMVAGGGAVVRVRTKVYSGGVVSASEALTFVPNVHVSPADDGKWTIDE